MICALNEPLYLHLISFGGGLLGGISMLVYMRANGVADGLRRILISSVSSGLLASTMASKIFGSEAPELVAACAFVLGFVAWNLLGAIAQFFENRKGDDIMSMLKTYKDTNRPSYGGGYEPNKVIEPIARKNQIDNPDN
jgi:hypothetical protein